MKTSTRKSLGALVVVVSVLAALVLYLSGVPLLSLEKSQTGSFPSGTVTSWCFCFDVHWSLVAVCISACLGAIAFVWPQRRPPRLQP
jgi:hypothetical protein